MRKIIVSIATSADGFIARKDGGVDWLDRPRPKGEDYGMGEFWKSIDTIVMGRGTYDFVVQYTKKNPRAMDMYRGPKHYAFSRKPPKKVLPGFEFVKESVKDFAQRLRSKKGKDIWLMGGGGIIASFLDAGEIDEFSISVIPVFIGEGIPLIAPRHLTVPLKLISSKKFSDGVVRLHYQVLEARPSGRATKPKRSKGR
jgi:dihydrofolate reductase